DDCEDTYTYTRYNPVFKQYSDFRIPITATDAKDLAAVGKIYYKAPYLFINKPNEGVHVFDNSNPESPVNKGFINIPGNIDIAIKGNTLFADSYTDLLAIDISNPNSPALSKRLEDAFLDQYSVSQQGILVDYEEELVTESIECGNSGGGVFWEDNTTIDVMGDVTAPSSNVSTGVGGSMARFTIPQNSNQLYVATISTLKTFDISNLSQPTQGGNINLGWNIETIYPFKDKLMIGSQTGMFIYDISVPTSPSYISQFNHAKACDPVVASGNYAYVTLREGNMCGAAGDELDVVDISNIYQPTLAKTYPMDGPYGLGVDNNTLFVCDGESGLKIYNSTDPLNLVSIKTYKDIQATDVIPYSNLLLMIGEDGFYQYDYSNLNDIHLLSKIAVKQ
ncbi:MAG TPA: hypothetical protein PK230_09345, partial [Chitinophagales bacterium]|nr:hypothetical protein [Chitinophagales bacterium]